MHRSSTNSFAKKHGRAFVHTKDGLEEGCSDLAEHPGGKEGEHEDAAVGDLGGAAADATDGSVARLARARRAADSRNDVAHIVASALDLESEARWWWWDLRRHWIWWWLARGATRREKTG
jgi:hypothetical protein